jgi:tripartite-type tricarboxylate transporter receptor subunit TctC
LTLARNAADAATRFLRTVSGHAAHTALPVVTDQPVGAGDPDAARAAPDGYTRLLGSASEITMLPAINNKLPFDPLKDFVPIARVADVPLVLLVHPALPARTPRELIELARKHPREINFGSTGVGSMTHLGMLLFYTMSGVRMEHVACKGVPHTDLMAERARNSHIVTVGLEHPCQVRDLHAVPGASRRGVAVDHELHAAPPRRV